MSDEKFMRLAIEEAKKSEHAGGGPIGAVLVKDGKVIASGQSLVYPKKDPTAHAETECIRAACQKLQTTDLSGCTLYSTLESCSMCIGCAAWTGMSRIVFGAYQEDVKGNDYEIDGYSAEEHGKRMKPPIRVTGGLLRDECKRLMLGMKNWAKISHK